MPPQPIMTSYLMPETVNQSMKGYENNDFVKWLYSLFDEVLVLELIDEFKIGTSKRWQGATVFFQIDYELRIRQAKVMLYNPKTGKRLKPEDEPEKGRSKIFFAGKSILKEQGIKEPELKQCFFGEHQLSKHQDKIVAIVESEKTAILMTAFSQIGLAGDYIWIATGGKNGCSWSRSDANDVLINRKVVLFPDLGAYDDWNEKSYNLKDCKVYTSDILEQHASISDQQNGLDIADYYLILYLQDKSENQVKEPLITIPKKKKAELPIILTHNEKILEGMIKENPLVQKLVDRFDLVLEERESIDNRASREKEKTSTHIKLNKHGYPASWG